MYIEKYEWIFVTKDSEWLNKSGGDDEAFFEGNGGEKAFAAFNFTFRNFIQLQRTFQELFEYFHRGKTQNHKTFWSIFFWTQKSAKDYLDK